MITLKIVVLPAPFGPDQAGDAALRDGEAAILQRLQPAEALVEAGDLEIRRHSRSPARPCGRNSMNAISSTP